MTRGTYGAIDRNRHPIAGWSEDRLSDYASDQAIIAASRPFLPAIGYAVRVNRAASWLQAGAQIGGPRQLAKPFAQVGGEFFHSIKDRQLAMIQLSGGFRSLVADLAVWHEANPSAPNAITSAQWIAADVTPTLNEWRAFLKHEHKSWWTKAATKWDTFEDWHDRLKRLRGLARAHGITLESQEPADLQETIWERGAEGKGGEGAALLGVLKVGVAASLGVLGFVTMYAVVRELRTPHTVVTHEREMPTETTSKQDW